MYTKEVFPPYLLFLKDTQENRIALTILLGIPITDLGKTAYIRVNTKTKEWFCTMDVEWLYRNQPPLSTVEDIKRKLI